MLFLSTFFNSSGRTFGQPASSGRAAAAGVVSTGGAEVHGTTTDVEELAFQACFQPKMVHAAVPTDVPASTLQGRRL